MNSMRIVSLVLSTALLLTACATGPRAPAQPDWVDGESRQHPSNGYLTGRGQAASQAEAADRARAEIAKIFAVKINAESRDVQTFSSSGDNPAQEEWNVSRAVATSTDQLLRGVEIADYWQDKAVGTWHALAVLSRARAGQSLRQEVAALDDATRGFLDQADASGELFRRIALVSRALQLQRERADLNRALQAVDITGRGSPAPWNTGALEARRNALMQQIRITPEGVGEHRDSVRAMLGAALAKSGMSVAPTAPYTMTGSLDYNDFKQQNWYWVRGTLQVAMTDRQGNALGVRRWELKTSATDAPTAERRFLDQVSKTLESELGPTIIGFALAE